ncbi:MAG: 2-succinyl-5-enolpyruvyl-6-hydroxy-3-cyclohexene-1-carboxylic-acid synthase [Chlamydiia bacterium]|nr:2-succinyl-5-enolpyruvyl-6-hydroxy-3-cyclohexene-1-carboxylic-acid synthase [Chlamydiia bacterium]
MQDSGLLNEQMAKTLIKELIHQGVRTFFIAPGARSAPLVTAAAEHPLAETIVHFDERALGFSALGYAKAKNAPAAIIVTSGTAVANLLPCAIEAAQSQTPLIILSADRPEDQIDCGANQAIDQKDIFSNYTTWSHHFDTPHAQQNCQAIRSVAAQAVFRAASGPVHINCPFRKPLLSENSTASNTPLRAHTIYTKSQLAPSEDDLMQIADRMSSIENGVIIVGSMHAWENAEEIESLARLLQWPIFADINSALRSHGNIHGLCRHHDLCISSLPKHEEMPVEGILHLGGPFVSNPLREWIAKHSPKTYIHIKSNPSRLDPLHLASHHIQSDPQTCINLLLNHLPGRSPSSWMHLWNELSTVVSQRLNIFLDKQSTISELAALHALNKLPQTAAAFIGNSMPIRDADALFYPKSETGPIFANRGASGIDGNIATAAGICRALQKPILAVVGDQTLLHDIGSLAMLKHLNHPLVILAINNSGGGIFSFLPLAKKQDIFEEHFAARHTLNFKQIAQSFNIKYENPKAISTLQDLIHESLAGVGPTLIEITTDRRDNFALHRELLDELAGTIPSQKTSPFPAYANT